MKENWLDNFAQTIEEAIYRQTFRGLDDEIVSVVYDTIQILYKNSPMKPFIFKKRLIEHPTQLEHYKELAKDGIEDIPTIKSLSRQISLPIIEDKNKKTSIKKPQLNLPKHWTMEEILRWIKHRPKKKQTFFLCIHLPAGISYEDFHSKEKYFASAVGGTCEITQTGAAVYMTVSNIRLQNEYLYSFDPVPYLKKMHIPLLLGHSISGLIVVDLAKMLTLFVAGLRDFGKSTFFHEAIYTILYLNKIMNRPYVYPVILDPKNREFQYFEEYGAIWAHDENEIRDLLELIDEDNKKRQNKMSKARNILEYNSLGNQMPHVAIFADEVDMIGEDETCRKLLTKAVKKYRSQGIYVLSATQRPSAKSFGKGDEFSEFKSQFDARLCLPMPDTINSVIALGTDKAAYLDRIPGRAIYKLGIHEMTLQIPYFPSEAKNKDFFDSLMSKLPKVALPYEDIKGEVYEDECFYPRKRSETGFESPSTSRSLKLLKSGTYSLT